MKYGVIIPVYKHGRSACLLAEKLAYLNLPIILVDDGNDAETKVLLSEFAAGKNGIILVRLEENSGKGGAVMKGIEKAFEIGLSHALQIDADGQHDAGRAGFFLEESKKNPDKVICAFPEYNKSAPKSRITGRKISNFWAAVVTLSNELVDVLCGFRVYPVDAAFRVTRNPLMDKRMGFDPEILVRLYWNKVFPVYHPVKINYPEDGISNFRIVRDNILISWTFTRLCLGMLLRLPMLVVLRIRRRPLDLRLNGV